MTRILAPHAFPKSLLAGAAAAALVALGGCGPVNRGLSSVHQPQIQTAEYAIDIPAGRLDARQRERLATWFGALKLGHGDRVRIDDPSGGYAAQPDVDAVLARFGLRIDPSRLPSAAGDPQTIRVIVNRAFADVTGCPDWRRPSQPEIAASTMSNYGCAVNSNLAAMIADPRDLIEGKSADSGDARTTVKAIEAWRKAETTGARALERQTTGGSEGAQ